MKAGAIGSGVHLVKGRAGLELSSAPQGFLWSEGERECPDFLTHFPRGETEGKGWGGGRLKAVGSLTSKTESGMSTVYLH